MVTIYGSKLFGVSLEQLEEWEGKREAVEWLRSKASITEVYYEVRHSFNLLTIVEIARLLKSGGSLYVVCSKEECAKIG